MFGTFAYLGTTEIWIIAGVVIVLFGGTKMAQLGKGLGEGIREFKKSMSGGETEESAKPAATPPATTPAEEK
jgi:sec-independent protein translocase protein TatA